ncbi:MAG: acyltransferase family protein [Acidimicrobiia bacterium]
MAHRRDIEGLRAIAVLLVLAYHAGLPGISGGYVGVDVFFVISGFLITGLLVREHDATGRIRFGEFYARRIRRLLPASFVVVLATLLASRVWLEPLRLDDLGRDAMAAAVFGTNVLFAARQTDYLQSALPPSPLQHYWSLGVEEQYYLAYPLLVWLALRSGSRFGGRRTLAAALGALAVASLALGVALTPRSPAVAFYLLPTRAWELLAGGLLALAVHSPAGRGPSRGATDAGGGRGLATRAAAGWLGLALVAVSATTYGEATAFPGWAALLPVAGAVLAIAAPHDRGPGPRRLLDLRPMQWIGSRSYALYLWHWPILIVARAREGAELGAGTTAACIALTAVASEASHRLVEGPIRRPPVALRAAPRSLTFGAALVVAGLLVGAASVAVRPTVRGGSDVTAIARIEDAVRASVGMRELPGNLSPSLEVVAETEPEIYGLGCHDHGEDVPPTCVFGDESSDVTIALVGDSHAAQWFEPLRALAEREGLRLLSLTRSGCTPLGVTSGLPEQCRTWFSNVLQRIGDEAVDLTIVSGFLNSDGLVVEPAAFARDLADARDALVARSPVMFIADTPRPGEQIPICLSADPANISRCHLVRTDAFRADADAIARDVFSTADATYLDLTDAFCAGETCPAVVGTSVVYRDQSHIAPAYALRLTDVLAPHVLEALGR